MCVACSLLGTDPRRDEPLASTSRHHFLLSRGPCRISCFFAAGVWFALSVSLSLAAWIRVRRMSSGWVCSHMDSWSLHCSTSRLPRLKLAELAISAKHVTRSIASAKVIQRSPSSGCLWLAERKKVRSVDTRSSQNNC